MSDRYSPTTSESGFAVRVPSSYASSMMDSSVVQPTPLRNLHKDFFELTEEMQVYVRIKPAKDNSSSILSISGNHVVVQPSKDSASFKNRTNAGTKTLQKFKFNKIYDSNVNQEGLFKDSALNLVQDFLMGKNALLFTYGATSAGKTYTMLGKIRDAGLLPRSIDVIFNSLEGRLMRSPVLKPLALNEIVKLSPQQTEAEEIERALLMRGFELDTSDTKDSISTASSGSLKDWSIRARDDTVCNLQHPRDYYSVWVSYCEIYNEQAFDLLDSCDRKKKRMPLRVTEDRKGKFYVKGLKEICVRTADEAVRVVLFGKENLHFAATKLNHNSSRSHCVFTVKIIRTNHHEEPTEATINMMSFVDLAGMERTTKTQSKGERLKEAGNINTSLLVLGRCIEAMRSNQQNPLNKAIIPYRESKLTRILQTFFSGHGRAAMFVNVSPSSLLCDETVHVLKFGALAQEVVIQPDKESNDVSLFAPPLRPSKFQQYVRKSISMMSARGSVLDVSSTFHTIGEEEDDLRERIRELEDELTKLKADWDEHETRVRDECCAEWTEMVTKMEQTWTQRYEETKARYEEFCETRVDLMAQLMDNCSKKKKRKVTEGEDLEHLALQFKDKDDRIEILEESNQRLADMVDKLKTSLKVSEEARADLQQEMTRLQFETAANNKPKMQFCGPDSDGEDEELETNDEIAKLKAILAAKEALLDEAVIDFHTKNEELIKAQQENEMFKKQLVQSSEEISDLQAQLEKSNLLLSDANERLDVREEELMNLEEKLMKANGQYGSINTELREAKRKIREYEMRLKEQSNSSAMSNMCEDLQKQMLEADSLLEKRKDEIERLSKEVTRWKNRALEGEDAQNELDRIRGQFSKSQIQLSILQKELDSLKEVNEDLKARRESLLDEVSHLKRDLELSSSERKQEEGNHSELVRENEEMRQKIADMKKLDGENKEFQKTMMDYEATIKELTQQLDVLRGAQRERGLLEGELEALANTLGRVQIDKSQMEKDMASQKTELERLTHDLASAKTENKSLQNQLEETRRRQVALEEQIQVLKTSTENSLCSTASQKESAHQAARLQIEKEFQEKFDQLERDNEKLTKEMLKHMRRAEELSRTVDELSEQVKQKAEKCNSLARRIIELETENIDFTSVQVKLREKELAIREKDDQTKSMAEVLASKEAQIEQLKKEHEQMMTDKNLDIARLQSDLKAMLSGHVNYKPSASIKIEKNGDDENSQEEDLASMMVTPTPVKTRRGRPKKVSSPESVQKEEIINSSSTRTRRTVKSVDLPVEPVPPSSTKSASRKPRKNKTESDEVAHPALSVLSSEEADGVDATPSSALNSKRRLYNAKCPDLLLPSVGKDENEALDLPKRMATRSRRQ